jgi:hyperosmotically inducible protein
MKSFLCACALASMLATPAIAADQADNSGKNVRDRGGETVTPMDQGGSATDREVTANIRKAIVDDDSLSTNAHNVKVITIDGVVTLRGPVKSSAEKVAVAAKAEKVAGVKHVDNKLEITTK